MVPVRKGFLLFLLTVREGNVFRSVCQSFFPRMRGSASMGGSAFREGLYPEGLYPGGSANRWVCLQEGGLQGGWRDSEGLPQTGVCIQGRSAPPPSRDSYWRPLQQSVHILLECIVGVSKRGPRNA